MQCYCNFCLSSDIICWSRKHVPSIMDFVLPFVDISMKTRKRCQNINGPLRWHHNGLDGVSNHQPYDCLFNRLFRRRSKKTSKLRVIGLCVGNSPGTGESPAQMASNAENVSIWWRHHALFGSRLPLVDCKMPKQSGAAANFGDRTYRQIWGPNVNNNIYILTHEYSSTGFE